MCSGCTAGDRMAALPAKYLHENATLDRVLMRMEKRCIQLLFAQNPDNFKYPSAEYLLTQQYIADSFHRMLNSKNLSELLKSNVHPQLFPRWFIMSPNATLLAYTGPVNIKEIRDQAALVSLIWQEQAAAFKDPQVRSSPASYSEAPAASPQIATGALETLTIESESANIIVRAIQPRLLLILVGGTAPTRKEQFFNITPEANGEARYPSTSYVPPPRASQSRKDTAQEAAPAEASNEEEPEGGDVRDQAAREPKSIADQQPEEHTAPQNLTEIDNDLRLGLLHLQRKKVDAATAHMREDFLSRGFVMPADDSIP